jgi:hypothetical protein
LSNQPVIELDLTEFKKEIKDDLRNHMDKLMEKMTAPGELKSLTESKFTPVAFDYRDGIEKVLHSTREVLGNYRDKYKLSEAVTSKYDEKNKTTSYSLTEAIGSLNPDCCIPEVWADKIERDHVYPGSVFLGAWFMNWYDDIEGKPGDKVHVCRVGPATCADLTCDEPTTTAATITCPYITLEHDTCAYYICREDIEDVQVGLVDALNEGLGSCLAVCVDNYFFNVALSCTNGGTVTSTGAMTGSLILEAMGSMLAGNQSEATLTGPTLYPSKADHAPSPVDEPDAGHQLQIRQPVRGTRRDQRRTPRHGVRHRDQRHPQGHPAHRRRHLPEPSPSKGSPGWGDEARHNRRERVQSALPEEVGHSRHQVWRRVPASRTCVLCDTGG